MDAFDFQIAIRRAGSRLRAWFPVLTALVLGAVILGGCSFAPKYKRPEVETPGAFKELTQTNAYTNSVWKVAEPGDAAARGKWWEIFQDAELNALEEQVAVSNQNVLAAFNSFLSARAIVKQARSQLYPTLAANPSVTRSRQQLTSNRAGSSTTPFTVTEYTLPLDASWQLDLWGRVRNTEKASAAEAQASAADLESIRLSAQGELAADYFQLRAQDTLHQLYADTVKGYLDSLNLVKVRYDTGLASDQDVAQAETQLAAAQADATSIEILRAQLEHAIAVLVGKAAPAFSIPVAPLKTSPPSVPAVLPSQLLERRPDIAAAERRVAEANLQIGVAKSAYYPTITLTASGGVQSTMIEALNWSSRIWSIGASASETIFDAGLRKATVQQYRAAYEANVAAYRQTVLAAFQQVEDNLSSIRLLSQQAQQQDAAAKSSERYLNLATDRYKLGIDSYLNVIVAQTALLGNNQTLVNLRAQLMTANVQLVENLGGGWDASHLPTQKQLLSSKAIQQ